MKLTKKYIVIHSKDNVAVALCDLKKGEIIEVGGQSLQLKRDIPNRYKFAIKNILKGEQVIKYGYPIGTMCKNVESGDLVHLDEVVTNQTGIINYVYKPQLIPEKEKVSDQSFMGYARENGDTGVRNEIWIVNTVGCVNNTAKILERLSSEKFGALVDGVYAFPHVFGCSQLGEDLLSTQRIMKGMVNHPNAAGVLVLSLGCERNNVAEFKKILGNYDERRVKFLICQDTEDEIEEGIHLIGELVEYARTFKRQQFPISKLKVGLKCGASDGFSGVSANPLVGSFSDRMTSCGGTVVLTEISEMFGAETILMNRCVSTEIFNKAVEMINDSKNFYIKYGQEIYENPSPGNRRGGISTLEEKSIGCIQKGGSSNVTDVLKYGEQLVTPGLNLLSSPGDDLIAITALAAAGCQIILFTTGNGNPLGAIVPTVKISSSNALYEKKKNWIDFNAGPLLEGENMDYLADLLLDFVLLVASGKQKTLNEINGYRDISMLKDGATT